MINNCINKLQDIFFQPTCLICRSPGQGNLSICSQCISQLKSNRHCCSRCSLPLETDSQVLCPQCQSQPPQFHQSFIPFQYRGEIVNLIRNFKFSGNLTSGRVVAELFCRQLDASDIAFPDVLVPVPLHPSRTRERGFNQALWLADKISNYSGIPVNHKLVSRTSKSRAQHQLNKSARLRNLENAFKVESSPNNDQNFPAHIAIVDDVVTTGATANTIANTITNTIASLFNHKSDMRIQLWAIARTPLE